MTDEKGNTMEQVKGNLMLLLTALIWGSAFVAQSVGMDYVGPFTFNAARNLLATGVLVPVVLAFGGKHRGNLWQRLKPDGGTVKGGLCCGLIMGIASNLQQVGLSMTTAGKAGFVTALYIILVPILGRFLGRTVRKILLLCVPMSLVGFYLLCVKGDFTVSFGDFLVFCCAVFFALHILFVDHFLRKGASGVRVAWIQFAMTCLLSALGALVWERVPAGGLGSALWGARWSLLYTSVLSSGVAYTLQIIGQKYTEPTTATLIMSLESVFAVLFGWLFLGEVMDFREIVGCVLVFVAVLLAQL